MSQIVTPPDLVDTQPVYLIVNVHPWDVEMIVKFLAVSRNNYTTHFYNDGMSDPDWLSNVSKIAKHIVVEQSVSSKETLKTIMNYANKIIEVGKGKEFSSAVSYLISYDRTKQN